MRKLLTVVAVAASCTLGACATNPTTGLPTIDQAQLAAVEARIQQSVATACKFVPTVDSVAAVVAGFVGASTVIDLVNQVTSQICNAVVAAPVVSATLNGMPVRKLARAVTTSNGTSIQGYFIR